MKIIIVGAGEVGYYLAKILAGEKHDIVVIDKNPERLHHVSESLDVMTIDGSGTRIDTLVAAGAARADMVIAVTSFEEVNLTACLLASKIGTRKKIIRVHDPDFLYAQGATKPEDFGIDVVIYPEGLVAQEIVRLVRRSAATEVLEFADGRIQLIGLKLDADSPLIGRKLGGVVPYNDDMHYRAVCIVRGLQTIIPTKDDAFRKGDQLFVICKTPQVAEMLQLCGTDSVTFDRIMILGGSGIGEFVAGELESELNVKLLITDKAEAERLAESLDETMVIHGDSSDLDLMATEGIMDMDAFIAVSRDEENNIIASLMAKHLGVKKTITHIEKLQYIPLSNTIGIDALVSKKLSAATAILKFIRKGEVVSAATLHGVDAEVIELVAQEKSKVTKKPIGKLGFPEGAIIGCVIRGDTVTIPVGTTQIAPDDRVVVLSLPRSIRDVEQLFS